MLHGGAQRGERNSTKSDAASRAKKRLAREIRAEIFLGVYYQSRADCLLVVVRLGLMKNTKHDEEHGRVRRVESNV